MKRVLFLWDAEAFGGHDVTALVALERLAAIPDLTVGALHTGRNVRLTEELERISKTTGRLEVVCVKALPCISESLDGLLRGPRTRSLAEAIDLWKPDWAVNVQGFITLGLCALGACRALRIPVVSYVPMAHRVWTLRPSPVSLLQDLLNRFWYSVPAAFITTSDRMKGKLVRERGVPESRVAVAEYGPDISRPPSGDRAAARKAFGFTEGRIIGVMGRVEFGQKRQDFLIQAVARQREALAGYRFVIVGDGPDLPTAMRLVEKLGVGDRVQFMAWQKDPFALYPALDAVLIPSRYEGVPLVMLEAMFHRIPVLASDVDGMADVLPIECRFRSGDAAEMVQKLIALPGQATPEVLDRLANLITNRFNAKIFAERFAQEIVRLTKAGAR
jgi:glycosyltransferase involved in cell wall biosynthesis